AASRRAPRRLTGPLGTPTGARHPSSGQSPQRPDDRMALAVRGGADTDDLVVLVDRGHVALRPALSAEVGDRPVLPHEPVHHGAARGNAVPDDLPALVDRDGFVEPAADRAEV